jgi:NO-binding membrane sensor protein with MHYT domain
MEISITKLFRGLEFEIWNLFGIWNLGFGIWNLGFIKKQYPCHLF